MRQLFTLLLLCSLLASCNQTGKEKKQPITSNGVQVAYMSCGDGDTSLLFLHGWCINKEYWQPQLNYFCPRYRVVAIDLPGFGESGKTRTNYDFDLYASDVKNVIEQLELKNVIVIGHSMSGDILLDISNKYPQLAIGIVGIDNLHEPGGPMNAEQQKETDAFFNMLSTGFDSTAARYMKPGLFKPETDTAIVNRVMNDVFKSDSLAATHALRSLIAIAQNEKTLMQGLSHKLYLVNSDVNPVKSDSLAKYCAKGFHVELVHATSHYPMIENTTGFNIALQKAIDGIISLH